MQYDAEVAFLSGGGSFQGSLVPGLSKNSILRLAQYKTYFNEEKRLELARQFVKGKLGNMRTMLMRYNRDHGDQDINDSIKTGQADEQHRRQHYHLPSVSPLQRQGGQAGV